MICIKSFFNLDFLRFLKIKHEWLVEWTFEFQFLNNQGQQHLKDLETQGIIYRLLDKVYMMFFYYMETIQGNATKPFSK